MVFPLNNIYKKLSIFLRHFQIQVIVIHNIVRNNILNRDALQTVNQALYNSIRLCTFIFVRVTISDPSEGLAQEEVFDNVL